MKVLEDTFQQSFKFHNYKVKKTAHMHLYMNANGYTHPFDKR